MKSFYTLCLLMLALLLALPHTASAQLLPDQRVLDFQNLAALYAKRYTPYDWKKLALGFDVLDLQPWLDRVRAAKDDLEFFEIEAEYVGKLQDTHSGFQMTSSFRANLGMTVDIYEGKVLIDTINRASLPVALFPFQIGDELVSVDGVSSEDWIVRISAWRQWGNPVSTRRTAAGQITSRSQVTFPRAAEIGNSAVVEIRRAASGMVESYTIPWTKTGVAVTTVGPVPSAHPSSVLDSVEELHNYKLPDNDVSLAPIPWATDSDGVPRTFVNGIGARAPLFAAGLPAGFVQRLGRAASDFHFSGTYVSNGLTIGYLRIPSFSPPSTALTELRNEIDFLQKNTDGLVVDVMRNPGGGCYMLDVAATLIPYPFYFFGEQVRATQSVLNSYQSTLESLRNLQALPGNPLGVTQQTVNTWQVYVDELKAALNANRGVTDPIPACQQTGASVNTTPTMNDNLPAAIVYTKPLIVLIDEFSISAADIFPSMIQDNGRALLVGARSAGGGGSVSGWPTGFYSESVSTNTNSLVVRKRPIVTSEYPTAPYVENIGARPDVPLDYMTRDNLLNNGRTFVNQFTQILVDQIRKTPGPTPFSISNYASASWSTSGTSPQTVTGYARIQPSSNSSSPNGLALIGFRQNNVLVSETGVSAVPLIQSGRIFVESSGSVNTAVAIANPNGQPSTIQYYFTGPSGNFGNGSFDIPANGQIANFLDQAPFNGARPLDGTFTFSASVPVAVLALRSSTNSRGEFLFTSMPVSDVGTAATGAVTFSNLAFDGGWSSRVVLVNPTDSQLVGTVQFLDTTGVIGTQPVNYTIPPRGSQTLATAGLAGSVRVVPAASNASPFGFVLASSRSNGVTVTEAAIPSTSSGSTFRIYAEAGGDYARGLIGSIQTGFSISNSSNLSANVVVELRRLDGSATGLKGTLVVPANGQISKFINQIPGLSAQLPFQGILRVSSSAPISVVGIRSRINERQDSLLTSIPAVNETAAPAGGEVFFPNLAEGGGYTTQLVLYSGSSSSLPSLGTFRFLTPNGGVLNLPLH